MHRNVQKILQANPGGSPRACHCPAFQSVLLISVSARSTHLAPENGFLKNWDTQALFRNFILQRPGFGRVVTVELRRDSCLLLVQKQQFKKNCFFSGSKSGNNSQRSYRSPETRDAKLTLKRIHPREKNEFMRILLIWEHSSSCWMFWGKLSYASASDPFIYS